jgi:hypothetical protein
MQELQSHLALQLLVARPVHDSHATFAELLFDQVVADSLP